MSRFLVLAGKGRKRCLDLKARSCSSFLPFLAEETGLGFALGGLRVAAACGSALAGVPGAGSTLVAVQSNPATRETSSRSRSEADGLLGVPRAAASAPVWGKGRRFSAVVCRQVNAGGGLACQSAALPAKGLGREGLASHVETGTLQRGEGWGYARGR